MSNSWRLSIFLPSLLFLPAGVKYLVGTTLTFQRPLSDISHLLSLPLHTNPYTLFILQMLYLIVFLKSSFFFLFCIFSFTIWAWALTSFLDYCSSHCLPFPHPVCLHPKLVFCKHCLLPPSWLHKRWSPMWGCPQVHKTAYWGMGRKY